MLKALLLSVLIATFAAPALTAGGRTPRRALQKMLALLFLAEVGYAFFLYFVYLRFA